MRCLPLYTFANPPSPSTFPFWYTENMSSLLSLCSVMSFEACGDKLLFPNVLFVFLTVTGAANPPRSRRGARNFAGARAPGRKTSHPRSAAACATRGYIAMQTSATDRPESSICLESSIFNVAVNPTVSPRQPRSFLFLSAYIVHSSVPCTSTTPEADGTNFRGVFFSNHPKRHTFGGKLFEKSGPLDRRYSRCGNRAS